MTAQQDRADPTDGGALPEVVFLDDLAKLLRCAPSTIERRVRAWVFPLAPLPGIDERPRWSKAMVRRWLAVGGRATGPAGEGGDMSRVAAELRRVPGGRRRDRRHTDGPRSVARRGTGGGRAGVRLRCVLAGGRGGVEAADRRDGASAAVAAGVGALRRV